MTLLSASYSSSENKIIGQWFILSKDGMSSYTYTWPISFTKICCGALSGNGNGPGDGGYATINMYNINMNQAFVSTYDIRNNNSSLHIVNFAGYMRCSGITVGY